MKIAGGEPHPGCHFDDVRAWLPKHVKLSNSGAQAIVYAAHWGAKRVILTGFDMTPGHWHEEHDMKIAQESTFAEWVVGLAWLAPIIARMGVTVLNATRTTAIPADVFPRVTIDEALKCLKTGS